MTEANQLSEEIKQSFDFMILHLGSIESDLAAISDEIAEMKEKLWLADLSEEELMNKYDGLSDRCKRALVGMAVVMEEMEEGS